MFSVMFYDHANSDHSVIDTFFILSSEGTFLRLFFILSMWFFQIFNC